MDIRKLQRAIVDGLEDVKGQHIAVFNTEHLSSMFERVIIASGTSNRQTKALAASVRDSVRKGGMQVLATEGEDNGEWIIVDCGAAVVHVMQPAIREYYHLEEIWGGKNVRVKVGEVNTKLVKASEPVPSLARSSAAKTAVKAAEKAAAQAISAAAGKPRAKRGEGAADVANKVANRSAAFKRVAAKSPAARSPAAKAPAKRAGPARPAASRAAPAAAPRAPAAKKAAPVKRAAPAKSAAAKAAPAKRAAPAKKAAAQTSKAAKPAPRKPRV
jgi:ribosome-associated protein